MSELSDSITTAALAEYRRRTILVEDLIHRALAGGASSLTIAWPEDEEWLRGAIRYTFPYSRRARRKLLKLGRPLD